MSTLNLRGVSFPVYKLGTIEPDNIDGVVSYSYLDEERDTIRTVIVDDKTVQGDTLAKRRLRLMANKVKLKKLSVALFYPGDLIKLSKPKVWFIDSSGKVFRYSKTKIVPLIFRKITKIVPLAFGGMLEVEGFSNRFNILYLPKVEQKYAGLLKLSEADYILYGVYSVKHKDTRRKI